jgi:hypothetical protein
MDAWNDEHLDHVLASFNDAVALPLEEIAEPWQQLWYSMCLAGLGHPLVAQQQQMAHLIVALARAYPDWWAALSRVQSPVFMESQYYQFHERALGAILETWPQVRRITEGFR